MERRKFLAIGITCAAGLQFGCRGHQFGHLIKDDAPDLVGSHTAGAEVFHPLVDESVAKLLARQCDPTVAINMDMQGEPIKKSICFVGIENKSAEELGDFKDQLYQQIDTKILESNTFAPISKRMVDSALQETRLRPESLMLPDNMRLFTATLQRSGQPIDYLLYATLTSGTTVRNESTQRDYLLTMELVNVNTGVYDKQSAEIRKGYSKTRLGKWWNYNPLKSR